MSESYFFALLPRFLKVEHSFAKTIKANTKYRIVVFKGIQKCDQMKQGIKSKLVGGKIDLQSPELFFNIQFYSPTKNIQFTTKLYEQKPNEEQTEIGSFAIMSSEYIKSYKNEGGTFYPVDGKFKDDLSLSFDLVIEKSKYSLTDAMKKIAPPTSRSNKQVLDENKSQSSTSRQVVRQGDGFLSPRKRLQRKAGHKGKLRSRNSSRSDGQKSPEGSVASSRRKWKKSPPSQQGGHFLHSPKKASPPKVSEASKGKSVPKSQVVLKSADTENKVEVSPKQNVVERPPIARSNIVSPPTKSSGLQSPVSQSAVRQPISQTNISQPLSPRTPQQSMSPKTTVQQPSSSKTPSQSNPPKQPISSPRNSKSTFVDLEVKHTPEVFDIVQRKNVSSPREQTEASTNNYQYQPPRSSKVLNSPKAEEKSEPAKGSQKVSSPGHGEEKKEKSLQKSNSRSISRQMPQQNEETIQITMRKTESVQISGSPQLTTSLDKMSPMMKSPQKTSAFEQSSVNIKMQGSIHDPKIKLIDRDDKSEHTLKTIQTKAKPVKKQKGTVHETGTLRGSLRLSEANVQKKNEEQIVVATKAAEQRKNQILYAVFLIVSAFLIYNAMMPTRRV